MACVMLLVLIHLITCLPFAFAITKTASFTKFDCDKYRIYVEPEDIYKVEWNGEIYPEFCSLNFKMRSIDRYQLCAEVTWFNLECDDSGEEKNKRYLTFYYADAERYDCNAKLPITYCDEDILYVKLEPYYKGTIKSSASHISMTISPKLISRFGEEYSSSSSSGTVIGAVIGSILVVVVIIVIVIICAAVRQSRTSRERQQPMTTINYTGVPVQTQPWQQYPVAQNNSGNINTTPTAPLYPYPGSPGQSFNQNMNTNSYRGHSPYSSNVDNSQNSQTQDQRSKDTALPPPSYSDVMSKDKDYGVM